MAIEMKNSNVEWIGQIPTTWSISKMKHIGQYINGYAFKPEDWGSTGKRIIRIQDLTRCNDNPNYYDGEIDEKYLVKAGDILVSWAATLDAFVWKQEDSWLNQHIFKALPNESLVKYDFFYWLIKEAMHNMANENLHGIMMQHVTLGLFGNYAVPLPDLDEQQKIADFLNKTCSEIDDIIKKTQSTIDEYKKLKKAIITSAVTKGIRNNRTWRDSSNIWYKEIPSDWDIKKIKYVFRIKKDIAGQEGYTVLSITQKGIVPKNISNNEGQLAENYSNYQLVEPGDFAMNHMDLLTGWVDISKYSGVTSPDYRVFVLNDTQNNFSQYYLYLMQMCYNNKIFYGLGQGVSGMGRWRLQADKFLNFTVPVPSYEEQKEIADYLDEKCAEMDALIAKKTALLEEMENYKKSVIYEYVTGKKRV